MIQANVVCSELGYHNGAKQATQYSHFGNVSDDFKMDDVHCQGRESHISECAYLAKDDCVSSSVKHGTSQGIFQSAVASKIVNKLKFKIQI